MNPKPVLPADRVSRNKKAVGQCKPVGMAIVRFADGGVEVSCGWLKAHPRRKVLEESAQHHLEKKHGGQGLWL